jgi:hypothetical protein
VDESEPEYPARQAELQEVQLQELEPEELRYGVEGAEEEMEMEKEEGERGWSLKKGVRRKLKRRLALIGEVFQRDERDGDNLKIPLGGRLMAFVDRWDFLLGGDLIRKGLTGEWERGPPPRNVETAKQRKYSGVLGEMMEEQIQEEVEEGVVMEVSKEEVEYLSEVGIVPKKGGKWRKILRAQGVNEFLIRKKFKMEDARQVAAILKQGDFAVTIDISKAYHHVPVAEDMKSYLSFQYDGKFYCYQGVPFGVSTAPRVFSAVMHHCATAVRVKWKIRCIQYLDDWLLLDQSKRRLQRVAVQVVEFLQALGWLVNVEKSMLVPRRRFQFLGWQWSARRWSVQLPAEKRKELREMTTKWMEKCRRLETVPIRKFAEMIGKLSATRLQFTEASAYLPHLYRMLTLAVRKDLGSWNGVMKLNRWGLKDLLWWNRKLEENEPRILAPKEFQATMTTDASPWGYGAIMTWTEDDMDREVWRCGVWKETEQGWTSNHKELTAVEKGLRMFQACKETKHLKNVLVKSDNTATVFDINRKKACLTLIKPLRSLLNFVRRAGMQIEARHIRGVNNTKADKLSRLIPAADYAIRKEVLKRALRKVQFRINADLFASKENTKSRTFCTLGYSERAYARDAMTISWRRFKPLLHPPIPMITRVLRKVEEENIEAALIAPMWVSQVWSPILERMTVRKTVLGVAERVLIKGKKMKKTQAQLPPGRIGLFIVRKRTRRDSSSL